LIYAALRARFSADKGLIPKPSKSRFYCVTGMQQRSDEAMAVFRVERNKGYTVMSNHHLRNKELSLKAKGLLSQMLSLPEDWDYTLAGLSFINREKIDAIREAVKELERAGYIVRSRERDEKGRLRKQLPAADSRLYWIYLHWKIQHWIIQRWKNLRRKNLRWKIQRN
jgi:hypothetical protein